MIVGVRVPPGSEQVSVPAVVMSVQRLQPGWQPWEK